MVRVAELRPNEWKILDLTGRVERALGIDPSADKILAVVEVGDDVQSAQEGRAPTDANRVARDQLHHFADFDHLGHEIGARRHFRKMERYENRAVGDLAPQIAWVVRIGH